MLHRNRNRNSHSIYKMLLSDKTLLVFSLSWNFFSFLIPSVNIFVNRCLEKAKHFPYNQILFLPFGVPFPWQHRADKGRYVGIWEKLWICLSIYLPGSSISCLEYLRLNRQSFNVWRTAENEERYPTKK